jgi:uncharacterized membrane protein YgcG
MRAAAIFRITAAIAIAFLAVQLSVAEDLTKLAPNGYVNDYAGAIDSQSANYINYLCREVEQKTQAQIAVVTVHSLDGNSPESYARNLFNRWGIGPRDTNRGVLVLLAIDDRKYRIEVGTGLEAVVTDRKSAAFGQEIVPDLRQAAYGRALRTLTRRIADAIALDARLTINDPPAAQEGPQTGQGRVVPEPASTSNAVLFVFFAALVVMVLVFIYILRRPQPVIGSSQPEEPSAGSDETEEQDDGVEPTPSRGALWGGYYNYGGPNFITLNIANHHNTIISSSSTTTPSQDAGTPAVSGGGFGGDSGFSGFGGGLSSGGGASKSWESGASAIADVVSCLCSFGGGSSSGGGASGSW